MSNKDNCKVSIIVAIYKSEKFLPKLIESLCNQTYRNLEIILVNDGSPDNSGVICDNFAQEDNRINAIHKKNGGTCEARNAGLGEATGNYIMIVDGDDWLEADCVAYLMNLIQVTDSEMAFSDKLFTTRDRVQTENDRIETWSAEKATAKIIYPYMKLGPWNKIYSKKLLDENNITFSVPWFGEGLYFATKASQHANHVGVGHRKIYNYRLNNLGSGLTNYNVQNGINALNNIYTTKKEQYIKSDVVNKAIDWHIWINHTFLLLQIIGSNQIDKYKKEYDECKRYIRQNSISVCINSDISIKQRIKILFYGVSPILATKYLISKKARGLKKDLIE